MSAGRPVRTIQLEAVGDGRLVRVSTGGQHIGSVRLTNAGWLPLGGFVFWGGLQPRYFRSVEDAATALVRSIQAIKRAKVGKARTEHAMKRL